jgi:hypothetical protein
VVSRTRGPLPLPVALAKAQTQKQKTFKSHSSFLSFYIFAVNLKKEEGLYNLYLVNCKWNYHVHVVLDIEINEKNSDRNYLSAGEQVCRKSFVLIAMLSAYHYFNEFHWSFFSQPLPSLFFVFSLIFFLASIIWLGFLRKYQAR